MDQLTDSISSFPLERVPRFQSVTSRADGAVPLDDLDQLHSELEKLLGAASLHLNTIEQYLRGDQLQKTPLDTSRDAKRKLTAGEKKKLRNSTSRIDCKPRSSDSGIEFNKLRKLDEEAARGGACFSFEALRDMPSNGALKRDPSVAGDLSSLASKTSSSARPSKSAASKVTDSTSSVTSHDEPVASRVLRSTAQSRVNGTSTPSLSSPPSVSGDAQPRRADGRFSSPSPTPSHTAKRGATPASRRNGEWHMLSGLLTPTLLGSASRLVGGRLLRRQPSANVNSRSLSGTPQRPGYSPQRPSSVSRSMASPSRRTLASAQSAKGSAVPKTKRSAATVPDSSPQRLLVALPPGFTSRHDIPKAFWRRFDELFMRELRADDLAFVKALRSSAELTEEELARFSAACNRGHTGRSSPRPTSEKRRAEPADDDDSPISKRLRVRCASGSQNDSTPRGSQLPMANGFGEPLKISARSPSLRASSPLSARRETAPLENGMSDSRTSTASRHAPIITVRNYSSKRNDHAARTSNTSQQLETILRGSRELNGFVSPRSRANQARNASLLKAKLDASPNSCVKNELVKRERETALLDSQSTSPSVGSTVASRRSELGALTKLVEAEKQATFALIRREIAQLSPSAPSRRPTESAGTTFKVPARLESVSAHASPNVTNATGSTNRAKGVGANTSQSQAEASLQRRPSLITDYFGRANGTNAANSTKRPRIAESESVANLLFCYSSECDSQLAEVLASDCNGTVANSRGKVTSNGCKVRSLHSLISLDTGQSAQDASRRASIISDCRPSDSRKRKRTAEDSGDFTKPLTVLTPAKCFADSLFGSPAPDGRLLWPTCSNNRKQPEIEVELQRLVVELRCTSEWSRRACEGLVATTSRQLDGQPLCCRLLELERTIAQLNAKMNDPQPHRCVALNEEDMALAQCAIEEREQLFYKLGIYDDV